MLETTRNKKLDGRYREWCRRNHRERTRAHEKRDIAGRLHATTIFDFFWRLRLRSNYQDVELFLMTNAGTTWQRQFYEAICPVTEATCLLLENLIIRRSGPAIYEEAIKDFRKGGGQLAEAVIGRRARDLLGG
jgi:hypothetical protein